jgi:glyoxylase-like metal-dependent hydrolase (beta-lactamase superfamily II)/rhodanese-related sulfurtransferase
MEQKDLNIEVDKLAGWLKEHKPVTILDVRPVSQREEWAIPESVHEDAYAKLNANDPDVFNNLQVPLNIPIVTVCAAGRTSMLAAEKLREKGYEVYSLQGGMKAWNYAWNTAEVLFDNGNIKVIQVRRLAKGCLSYIIGSGNEAIVIDASLDPEVYQTIAKENAWQIKFVMDTHIHADYISRTGELAKATEAKYLLFEKAEVGFAFTPIKDKQVISFGNTSISIMHTPGHTWESVSYALKDFAVFTGDTLFTDGIGRPDLKADEEEATRKTRSLFDSIQKLLKLSSSTIVFPAHTSHSVPFDDKPIMATLEQIYNQVPLVKLPMDEFIQTTLSKIPPAPPNYQKIAELNRNGNYDGYVPADLEAGANRCAVA